MEKRFSVNLISPQRKSVLSAAVEGCNLFD